MRDQTPVQELKDTTGHRFIQTTTGTACQRSISSPAPLYPAMNEYPLLPPCLYRRGRFVDDPPALDGERLVQEALVEVFLLVVDEHDGHALVVELRPAGATHHLQHICPTDTGQKGDTVSGTHHLRHICPTDTAQKGDTQRSVSDPSSAAHLSDRHRTEGRHAAVSQCDPSSAAHLSDRHRTEGRHTAVSQRPIICSTSVRQTPDRRETHSGQSATHHLQHICPTDTGQKGDT